MEEKGLREEEVVFESGTECLYGKVFFPKTESLAPPTPAAVLCHGIASDHREMMEAARYLARRGVAALAFDLRGHGRATGICGRGILQDVPAAYGVLAGFPQVDRERIALVGHSMGAKLAIEARTGALAPAALVLLSCPRDIEEADVEDFRRFCRAIPQRREGFSQYPRDGAMPWTAGWERPLGRLWMWLTGRKLRINWPEWGEFWERARAMEILPRLAPCPVLIGHCRGDSVIPAETSEKLYGVAPSPKKLLLWDEGSHSAPLQDKRCQQEWLDWLVETLKAPGGEALCKNANLSIG